MSKKNEIKGNCACGNVKYKVEGKPLFTQACHCKNCKISTGSSFVIHTMIMEEDFKISGDVASINLPTGSGKGYHAYFCIICGVYVFCRYGISKGRIALRTQKTKDKLKTIAGRVLNKWKKNWSLLSQKFKKLWVKKTK